MTKLISTILIATTLVASGQSKKKKQSAAQPSQQLPAQQQAALAAMAATNFTAKCALDYRWKSVTNQIAAGQAKLKEIEKRHSELSSRYSLELQSGQNVNRRNDFDAIRREEEAQRQSIAALRIHKLDVEGSLHKMYPNLK